MRPEDMFDQRSAPPKPTITPHSMKVQVEEVSESDDHHLLLLNTGQDTLTAVASRSSVPPAGASLDVVFDLAKIHLFDEDSGKRIT